VKQLDVLFQGWGERWVLGTLADNSSELLFEYADEALRRGIEFSKMHLALRREAYGRFPAHLGHLPGLLSDALPDGWGLLLMDRMFRLSGRDPSRLSPLDRLSYIGDRAMGALTFEPSNGLEWSHDDLSLRQLAHAAHDVIEDRDSAALKTLALLGGSPHGARPKVLVQFDARSRTISTRDDGPGTPWLMKFPARTEHREVCAIEHVYSTLARACGIEMPRTEHFGIDRQLAAFGIERFDRANGLRVPVHSFAGALHADFRLPSLDYETLLRATRFFTNDEREVRKAFVRCVFNVVFNNRDDHAKNFALRMNEHMEWKLAPAFDLTFAIGPRGQHQTSIMGEAFAPGRAQLLALAKACGVPQSAATAAIDPVCAQALQLGQLLDDTGVRKATCKALMTTVLANLQRCQ
jgi:serine/threonine-protein kinase HipA